MAPMRRDRHRGGAGGSRLPRARRARPASRRGSDRPRSRPRHGGRTAARRSRGVRASGAELGISPAGERDHRCAVARRDVPALQPQPVAGRELDVLMRRAEIRRRHLRLAGVRDDVREGDRLRDDEQRERRAHGEQQPPPVAPPERVVTAPRAPQRHGADSEQQERPGDGEESGVVVARRPGSPGVVDGLGRAENPHEPDDERDGRARARAEARVEPARESQQGERHEACEEVVGRRCPGVGLNEVVVGDMERDEREPEPRETGLAAQRGAYARPRDGSRQWTGGGGMAHDVTPGEREKCMRPACRAAAPATSGSHPEPNPDFRQRGRGLTRASIAD